MPAGGRQVTIGRLAEPGQCIALIPTGNRFVAKMLYPLRA